MNNTQKLLERVRDRVPRKSKNGVATAIGADEANTRRYFKGMGYPNPTHCMKIAKILGLDASDVILYVQEDKTKNIEDKDYLRSKLPRLLPAITFAFTLLAGGIISSKNANASTMFEHSEGVNFDSRNCILW